MSFKSLLLRQTGLSRLPVYGLLLILLCFFGWQYKSLMDDVKDGVGFIGGLHYVIKRVEVPTVKYLEKVKTKTVTIPVTTYEPSKEQLIKLEGKYDFSLKPDHSLLGIYKIGVAPAGGTAVVDVAPDGHVGFSFKPFPPSFFQVGAWGVGGGYEPIKRNWRAFAEKEFRVNRVTFRASAGFQSLNGTIDPYVWVDGIYKF